ncbi:putative uncharacterized protein [Pseudomonas sp. StFLB209]|uniref:DUF4123 domain-containing protein n=1 Tax=Pseudomonas sp. StFLB209 TaxID=1028989 RepID=UPI0004F74823|nr:DUF4123 domain-containing protein [Pseudomonas sp. StFLB209]BAP43610.1 putative uncharacterized protein [Pseudomonas sp. StFLB209]
MSELESGPANLPWSSCNAFVLFNAVNVPQLAKTLYQCRGDIDAHPVFLMTRFKDLVDKSPYLAAITDSHDPVYQLFLEQAGKEWGLLLFSQATTDALLQHLRWLLFVDEPGRKPTYLNISDPLVANALFGLYPRHTDNRLFGPIDQLYAVDVIDQRWIRHVREGCAAPDHNAALYCLNPAQTQALGDADLRIKVVELEQHMHRFFPDYLPDASLAHRYQHLYRLARQACEMGFSTEIDLFHYANVSQFLDRQPPEAHADIRQLVLNVSSLTHSQRIQQANALVVERARTGALS